MQTDKKVTELVIDEERRLAWIQFPSGTKSRVWGSKDEAIDGICRHIAMGEITAEELKSFFKKIAVSRLPMGSDGTEELLIYMMENASMADIGEVLFIRNPTFTMCDCGEGGRHGCIEDDDGQELEHVGTRHEAFWRVIEMLAGESIDEAGAEKLRTKIQRADFGATKEFPILLS